ncbi:hypothetical protein [Acidovorax sp. LjRoot117]|uniref:hypothetical protein n=1 Tax=Acidovorax sp. LjRoot117 TaxID=3342255 RepID=UPI003ECF83A7
MGISMDAMLLYGVGFDELSELEDLGELLDNGEMDYASPYYDSPRDEWVVGVALPSEIPGEAEMLEFIRQAKAEFESMTGGLPGRLIVSPNIT